MLSQKTKQLAVIALVLASTACSTTANRSVIDPTHCPKKPIPTALLTVPPRPEPPEHGDAESLLNHAVEFGQYVKNLENQIKGWLEWAEIAP